MLGKPSNRLMAYVLGVCARCASRTLCDGSRERQTEKAVAQMCRDLEIRWRRHQGYYTIQTLRTLKLDTITYKTCNALTHMHRHRHIHTHTHKDTSHPSSHSSVADTALKMFAKWKIHSLFPTAFISLLSSCERDMSLRIVSTVHRLPISR